MNQLLSLQNLFSFIDVISFIILNVAAYNHIKNNNKIKLDFSFGSVIVKRKDINSSNLTNIVSQFFYNGGTVPDKIRAEIMAKTNTKNYGIEIKEDLIVLENK
jgi:hypothetical protein